MGVNNSNKSFMWQFCTHKECSPFPGCLTPFGNYHLIKREETNIEDISPGIL